MIISQERIFRVRLAYSQSELRTPQVLQNAYYSGNRQVAIHSAVQDAKAMGEGACFIVDKWQNQSDRYDQHQCGEIKNGYYYPRNNF